MPRMIPVCRDDANVRGDHGAIQIDGKFHDAPAAFDAGGIACRIRESVTARVTAKGGDDHALPADISEQIPALRLVKIFGRHCTADGIKLHSFRAEAAGLADAFPDSELQ